MRDEPRRKLAELIARDGATLGDDASRVRALLLDYCGECKAEIAVLASAAQVGIPRELAEQQVSVPLAVRKAHLARRLQNDFAFSSEAAQWGVAAWAAALGLEAWVPGPASSIPSPTWSTPQSQPSNGNQWSTPEPGGVVAEQVVAQPHQLDQPVAKRTTPWLLVWGGAAIAAFLVLGVVVILAHPSSDTAAGTGATAPVSAPTAAPRPVQTSATTPPVAAPTTPPQPTAMQTTAQGRVDSATSTSVPLRAPTVAPLPTPTIAVAGVTTAGNGASTGASRVATVAPAPAADHIWKVAGIVNIGEPSIRVVYDTSVGGSATRASDVVNLLKNQYRALPQPGVIQGLKEVAYSAHVEGVQIQLWGTPYLDDSYYRALQKAGIPMTPCAQTPAVCPGWTAP